MADSFKEKDIDTYKEHWCHQSYHKDCSECYKENRLIQSKKTVTAHEEMLERHPALKSLDYHLSNLNPLN